MEQWEQEEEMEENENIEQPQPIYFGENELEKNLTYYIFSEQESPLSLEVG